MDANKQTRLALAAFLAFATVACVNESDPAAPVHAVSLKLANGSPVSEAAYDDYNPIILQLSNGTLALIYASNRTCAVSCTNHNVFIASSVGVYGNDGKLPAFNTPQVVTANASPLNFSTRLRLAARASGNNINVFVKDVSGVISETGLVSPVSAVPINVGASLNPIAAYNCYTTTLLGLDASGLMISTAGSSGPISRYDSTSMIPFCPTNTLSNTGMAFAVNISVVRSADIGIAEGFLMADPAGKLVAHTATNKGPTIQNFSDALSQNSLFLTSATAFISGQSAGDLLVFSAAAASGLPSDMFILANKTPSALWLKYTAYGAQPKP